jgi:hypothetical protein
VVVPGAAGENPLSLELVSEVRYMRKSAVTRLTLLVWMAVLTVGCTHKESPSSADQPTTVVRVAHMADGHSNIDVWVGDWQVCSDVEYFDITPYTVAGAGTQDVHISTAGSSPPHYLFSRTISLAASVPATISVVDRASELDVLVYEDDRTTDATKAKFRFIHLAESPEAISVDWGEYVHVFAGVQYAAATAYRRLDPGMYDMLIRDFETDSLVYTCPDVELPSGHTYTMFLVGTPGAMGFAIVADDA